MLLCAQRADDASLLILSMSTSYIGTVTLSSLSSLVPPGPPPPPTILILPYVLVLCSARALDHCGVWTFTELPLIKQNKGGWTGPGVRKGWRSPTHGLARRRWVLVREKERESLVMCIHRQRFLGRPRFTSPVGDGHVTWSDQWRISM